MATQTKLNTHKLEENPLLPLDTQANLVYVLTRIFRLLAQIVNPLVEWANNIANSINVSGGIVSITNWLRVGTTAPGLIEINKPAANTESVFRWSVNNRQYWYWAFNVNSDMLLCKCNPSTGDYVQQVFGVSFTTGTTTLRPLSTEKTALALEDAQPGQSQGANISLHNATWTGRRFIRVNVGGDLCFINNAYNQETHRFSNTGETVCALKYNTTNFEGLSVTGTGVNPGVYTYQNLLLGNPGWNGIFFRSWHQHGAWAGFTMEGGSPWASIQFVISTGNGWGNINCGALTQNSDRNNKENEEPIASALDVLDGIQAYSYTFKAPNPAKRRESDHEPDPDAPMLGENRRHVGTMAQDWVTRLPQAVKAMHNDQGESLGLDYTAISAVTAQAVSELLQRVKTLETRVTELEGAQP